MSETAVSDNSCIKTLQSLLIHSSFWVPVLLSRPSLKLKHGRIYNLRHPTCVLSRPTHADQRLLSRTSTSRGRVSKCQSSGVPHLVTYRRRRWAVRRKPAVSSAYLEGMLASVCNAACIMASNEIAAKPSRCPFVAAERTVQDW